jgi:hypothetical protein
LDPHRHVREVSHQKAQRIRLCFLVVCTIVFASVFSIEVSAQRKSKKKPTTAPTTELAKLRDEFVKATNEYKTSLTKLLAIYEGNVKKAEEKLALSQKLLAEGLISKLQVEENERALAAEKNKVDETRRQMTTADEQVAGIFVESEAEREISKNLRLAKQSLVRTALFTRYTGSSGWGLNDAWKVQRFFSDSFNKPLPVAVFGQGPIHDRWRLDHHNAMDISLHPDSVEGQALLNFLQKNGIPYLAFRAAIPGTATGPHIHIGRPSHRY